VGQSTHGPPPDRTPKERRPIARRLAVEIVGDSRDLERAFKRSGKSAETFNKDVTKTGKNRKLFGGTTKAVGGLVAGLGAAGLAGAAKAAFTEMGDAQKVSAQTAAALKSTGRAANVTAGQMDKLATALMNKSGVDDEAIKSSENLLLTFTNIRNETGKNNDIFNQATKATLDMSTALGTNLKGSSILVGKALNDPIKGMTALRRVGVSFTDEQKDMVEGWVQHGKTLKAQKFILGELTTEFGGSAKAAGQTLPGALNKLKENALNLGGTIATLLTPQIQATITKMSNWLSKSENQKKIMDVVKGTAEALTAAVKVLKGAWHALTVVVGGNKRAVEALIGVYATFKVLSFASKIATLAASFGTLKGKMGGAKGAATGFRGSLAGKAGVAGAVVLAGYELSNLIRKIPGWDNAMKDFGASIYNVATNLGLVKDPMAKFGGKAMPHGNTMRQIAEQARRLEAGGRHTGAQATNILARRFPQVSRYEIQGAAGVRSPTGSLAIYGGIHLHGVTNTRQLEDELRRRNQRRPHARRNGR
jgi:hypothetical protein